VVHGAAVLRLHLLSAFTLVCVLAAHGAPAFAEAPPATAEPASPVVRGLSWDMLGGGVPQSGALLQVEAGFSALPRVSYHHTLRRGFSIGGQVGLDYGYYRPQKGFLERVFFAAPIRWTVHRDSQWSVGFQAAPGVALGLFDGLDLGLMAALGGSFAYTLENRIIIGGGVELPMLLNIPTSDRRSVSWTVPILAGPLAEFHITPPLALTLDTKMGVLLDTAVGARFAFKLMVGAAYRM